LDFKIFTIFVLLTTLNRLRFGRGLGLEVMFIRGKL